MKARIHAGLYIVTIRGVVGLGRTLSEAFVAAMALVVDCQEFTVTEDRYVS